MQEDSTIINVTNTSIPITKQGEVTILRPDKDSFSSTTTEGSSTESDSEDTHVLYDDWCVKEAINIMNEDNDIEFDSITM